MTPRTLNNQQGIALGPILFIIAILAILAGAIAAGSSSFTANTNAESAKAMAGVIVNQCGAYQDAVNVMLGNGCDETMIDWTPPGFPAGITTWNQGDLTGGNGTNRAGNGQCALFDPRGGGMIFKPVPSAALASTTTGGYTTSYSSNAAQADALAGYPVLDSFNCVNGYGVCSSADTNNNSPIVMSINYLNQNTCQQINNIAAKSTPVNYQVFPVYYPFSFFAGGTVRPNGSVEGYDLLGHGGDPTVSGVMQGCGVDAYSNSSNVYDYVCIVMVR